MMHLVEFPQRRDLVLQPMRQEQAPIDREQHADREDDARDRTGRGIQAFLAQDEAEKRQAATGHRRGVRNQGAEDHDVQKVIDQDVAVVEEG